MLALRASVDLNRRIMNVRRIVAPWMVGLALVATAHVRADAPTNSAASGSVAIPLPTIPRPQPTTLPPPDADSAAELDKLLDQLAGMDDKARDRALEALSDQDTTALPAVAAKLAALRKSADRDAMGRLLEAARKAGRDTKEPSDDKDTKARSGADEDLAAQAHPLIEDPKADWLAFVLAKPAPSQAGYEDLVAVLALARVCACIGSTAAARELINVYTYFGELFRIDVQRQLARMGDRALPALIEASYHDSKMVRSWASRRLDLLGKAIPSEAVRTSDTQALADVIRAYGRAREVEAVRAIVGFANSDRLQVRTAAREAIGMIGEPARWQLRDAYEGMMGRKAPPSWDWKRTAQELFAEYDRSRLQEVYATMEQGLAQMKDGKVEEAVKRFDQVLARAPMFERRAEMVPAYLQRARALRDEDRPAALALLRKAETIDPAGPSANAVRAEIAVIEAEDLAARGVFDVTLLEQAVEMDPSNTRAQGLLDQYRQQAGQRQTSWRRYAAAASIGVIALGAMVFIALGPRRKKQEAGKSVETPPEPPTPDEAPRR